MVEVSLSPDIQYFADENNVMLYYRLTDFDQGADPVDLRRLAWPHAF